ncbi:MAG: pantoate--beta-alanine ligase [Dehalococcoidaceae bacterium]|nr:pantoate--beta-alanine ligase [Dehalococcoidaceae bacterium]
MKIITTVAGFARYRPGLAPSVGLVPTMGCLHEGHLSLLKKAREENRSVVASIFVNPAQFGPNEDFSRYPRTFDRDCRLLDDAGVDTVFAPPPEEMYPEGYDTWVEIGGITQRLEGSARPGHFRGVATIVLKLFNIIKPEKAYFGQKDAQQALVIRKMARELNLNISIRVLPIVRDEFGLALSSRNTYLSTGEKTAALQIPAALKLAEKMLGEGKTRTAAIKDAVTRFLEEKPVLRIDYVSIAEPDSLKELETIDRPALLSLAVWAGSTRLIDNIVLTPQQKDSTGR